MSRLSKRHLVAIIVAGACAGGVLANARAATAASYDPNDWPMYNHDAAGSRTNPAETKLSPQSVGGLQVAWRFATPASVYGTPAVVDGVVYAGDVTGTFYALDATTGLPKWVQHVPAPITGSALVAGNVVIFGDLGGTIYGLNRQTGLAAWPPLHPNPHLSAAVWGSPTLAGDAVVVGISSQEETFTLASAYPCCSFRGSVFAFDPVTGVQRWHTYTISDAEATAGSSGASVWATPTYDPALRRIYVTTGNNFSFPATATSDAVLALDADTGAILWKNQLLPNDVWNFNYPFNAEHPDADFGDSPQVFRLKNGKRVVAAGQKSGFYHLLDAATGKVLDQVQLEPGGILGGLFADTATFGGITFANGINWPNATGDPLNPVDPGAGDLVAVRTDVVGRLKELWRVPTPGSPNLAGVAVANGVVYFHSSASGILYAVEAATGRVLKGLRVGAGISGPSIANGHVYLGTGDTFGIVDPDAHSGAIVALAPLPF
jgi:polyvinyl alcohol dehydrogenase (cytochrome)